MKLAISSSGKTLESNVDPRFGRCPYFIIYDIESGDLEAIENQSRQAMGGAGIQAAQRIADKKVEAAVTGNVGPNAYKVLSSASIKVFSGISGTVEEAIEKIKKGELKTTSEPDVPPHFGEGPNWNE
jgi:predicted Fe-Mo cluster-binding NifX family protein